MVKKRRVRLKLGWGGIRSVRFLEGVYWKVVVIGIFLTLARFSQAFLLLKAHSSGFAMMFVPLVVIAMNTVYALSSYPAGVLSDYMDRRFILLWGIVFLIIGDLVLGFGDSLWIVFVGAAFWGLHMGFTEGILAAMITDVTKEELRGTAFGFYNCVTGFGMLGSNLIAGLLWDSMGSSYTFYIGAFFSMLAFVAVGVGKTQK